MAFSIRFSDVVGQSTYTRGIASGRYDRALRVLLVEGEAGIDNPTPGVPGGPGNVDLREAILQALATVGNFHHMDTSLPLRAVTARKLGPLKAYLYLEYARPFFSTFPNNAGMALTSYRTDFHTTEWYQRTTTYDDQPAIGYSAPGVNGYTYPLPVGAIEFWNGQTLFNKDARGKPWEFTVPALRFYVRTLLNYNPIEQVFPLVGKINDRWIKFGNSKFPPYTVMFNGVRVDPVNAGNNVIKQSVLYDFKAIPTGFWQQRLFWVPLLPPVPGGMVGQWVPKIELGAVPVQFAGAFPI